MHLKYVMAHCMFNSHTHRVRRNKQAKGAAEHAKFPPARKRQRKVRHVVFGLMCCGT